MTTLNPSTDPEESGEIMFLGVFESEEEYLTMRKHLLTMPSSKNQKDFQVKDLVRVLGLIMGLKPTPMKVGVILYELWSDGMVTSREETVTVFNWKKLD